ncbi:MAG: hypothetical protein HYY32_05140 [Chloroflexi bacterium]|nr:hypothetical protein [Chloroflexota bacterium]
MACVSGDSIIYTPAGPRTLAGLKPREPLYSFDDYTLAERACLGVSLCGVRPVLRVTIEDGRSVLATRDQMLVKVVDPRSNLKWAMRWFVWEPLAEFRPGDTLIAAKVSPEKIVQRPLVEEEEFARYIGFRDSSLAEYAVNPFFDETYVELLTITSIEAAGEAEVYEVSVQFDESFVVNGLVVL